MTSLARRILPRVILPTMLAGGLFGALDVFWAFEASEDAAQRDLVEAGRVAAELLEAEAEQAWLLADTLLGQENLENHFLLAMAGMADDAENERLELEAMAQQVFGLGHGLHQLDLFRGDGARFLAIEEGARTLRPLDASQESWWPRDVGVWHAHLDGDSLDFVRRMTLASELDDVVVRLLVDRDGFGRSGLDFAEAGREGLRFELHGLGGETWYTTGAEPVEGPLQVQVPLDTLDAFLLVQLDPALVVREVLAQKLVVASLLLVLCASLVLVLWTSLRATVLQPLRSMMALLDRLAGGEVLGEPLPAHHAELSRLDAALRETLAKQQASADQLVQLNLGLERRVAERTTELEAMRDEALAASTAKSQFLANMSHEIRTPMNGVIGMAEILSSTELEGEQRSYVETIRRSGEALLGVINDILDFSKIEAGKLEVEEVDHDLHGCVHDVAELLAEQAQTKGLELLCDVAPQVPTHVVGDPVRLRQILLNLLGNGIKFTTEGTVQLRARVAGVDEDAADVTWNTGESLELEFEVIDSGIGISDEAKGRIFDSFSQADASTTRQYGGTGLGLTITRRLVELMGGELGVESELGEGSRFHFRLPVTVSAQCGQVYEQVVERMEGKRFLVVDDLASNRRILQRQLQAAGIEVVQADSGLAAIQAVNEELAAGRRLDVAILDQQMPHMSGLELSRRLRPMLQEWGTPMVLLSSVQDRSEDPDAPLDLRFTKPARPSVLLTGIDGLLRGGGGEPRAASAAAPAGEACDTEFSGDLLLVEDNRVNQLVAKKLLGDLGFTVHLAENGQEAVDAVLGELQPWLGEAEVPATA